MKKIVSIFLVTLSSLVMVACGKPTQVKVAVPAKQTNATILPKYQMQVSSQDAKKKAELASFIDRQMVQKEGIYTNLTNSSTQKNVATGHEMLSESSGMWLNYLASNKKNSEYQQFLKQTETTFKQGNQYSYRYDPSTGKQADVNATIDDLRIIRSMVIYDAVNHTTKYQKKAAETFSNLSQNVIKKGKLIDFYDVKLQKGTSNASLAYFDLRTLKYFESATKSGQKNYQKQLKVLKNGYLGDVFPLYAASYNWKTQQYSQANLNGSEALEVLLHLSDVGEIKKTSLNWLRLQIDKHQLANTYSITGQIINKQQSAANYGLAAMIFSNVDDQAYYQKAMNLVWKSQVQNNHSKLNGGIGLEKSNEFYSYNNLVALLAAQ